MSSPDEIGKASFTAEIFLKKTSTNWERPAVTETTALGAAFLAGLEVGLYPSLEALAGTWRSQRRFEPKMAPAERARLYGGWLNAVRRVRAAI